MHTNRTNTKKKKNVLFIIGDWNAKVGSQEIPGVMGNFGLGVRKEARQRLIEFSQENALVIANTLFQQHKRRPYMDITRWSTPKSVQFSRSVMSDSLRPHESRHARPPCSSPSPRVHSNSRLLLCCWKRVFAMTSAFS